MSHQNKRHLTTKRLVLNAMLVAIYVVLRHFSIPLGNAFRFTLGPFSVILCATLYGPVDGLIVGFVGEFLAQMLSYGLTATTLLWCIGETVRGGMLGLLVWLFLRKWMQGGEKLSKKQTVLLLVFCAFTAVLAALGQTLALYVDSKMLGYYEYHAVFGLMVWRILIYIVLAVALGCVCQPIIIAMKKARLVK